MSSSGVLGAGRNKDKATAKAAFLLATAGAAFALLDASHWHAGIEAWDQIAVLGHAQEANEGLSLPWRFGGGRLYLEALRHALAAFGPDQLGLRLPNLLLYAVECLLLWVLGSRLGGPIAGLGAVALNAVAAFTWIRLRSLLGFVALPAELLTAVWLASGPGRWRGLALGALLALAALDYEAWVVAIPVVGLWWWAQPREQRPSAAFAAGAFAVLLPWVLWGTRHSASNFAWVRLGPNLHRGPWQIALPWGQELWRQLSGLGREDLLLERLPAVARFSLPLLGLGLLAAWRGQRRLLLWLLLGLAPLAAVSDVAEAQRAVVAWPALCLLGGLGSAWLLRRYPSRNAALLLALLFALGAGAEANAYLRMQDRVEPLARGYWRRVRLGADTLAARPGKAPLQLLDGLNWRGMAEWRALTPSTPGASEVWAVIPPDYAPTILPTAWGQWTELRDPVGGGRLLLLHLAPEQVKLFTWRSESLNAFRRSAPRFDGPGLMAAAAAALDGPLGRDPWTRRALVDAHLHVALEAHSPPAAFLPLLLAQPQLSISQACIAAVALQDSDPAKALHLAEAAYAQDPSRDATRALLQRLRAAPRR